MKTLKNFSGIILLSFISVLFLIACEKEKVYNDSTSDFTPPVISAATVSTYAGGNKGYVDGPVEKARFLAPSKIVVAQDGALYIADLNKIRKIDQNGIVSTFAGCKESDIAVDGTGLDASFANIASMTISKDGNLFVTEVENIPYPQYLSFVVARKITPQRVVTTFIHEESRGGNLYYISKAGSLEFTPDNTFYQVDNSTGPDNRTESTILKMEGVARIALQTHLSYGIKSLAVGQDGAIYILNENNELYKRTYEKIWQVNPGSGSISSSMNTHVSAIPDIFQDSKFSAALDYLDIGKDGTIYITNGVKIWKISTAGKMDLVAGGEPGYADGAALEAKFEKISSIALAEDDSVLYVIDKFRIRRIDL